MVVLSNPRPAKDAAIKAVVEAGEGGGPKADSGVAEECPAGHCSPDAVVFGGKGRHGLVPRDGFVEVHDCAADCCPGGEFGWRQLISHWPLAGLN